MNIKSKSIGESMEDDLLKKFEDLAKRLGKTPSRSEMKQNGLKVHYYYKHFGTLKNVSDILGLTDNGSGRPIKKYTKRFLLGHLLKLKKVIGRIPTYKDILGSSVSPGTYYAYFGSLNNALKMAGLMVNKNHNSYSKEEIIADINRVSKKLCRPPTSKEFGEYSKTVCWHSAANIICKNTKWNDVLAACGLGIKNHRDISTKDLALEIRRLKDLLGHVPSQNDMSSIGKYSITPYRNRYKTYRNAIKLLGFGDLVLANWKNRVYTYGKDKRLYKSKFEAAIANILYNKNIAYEYEKIVCCGRKWTCDFYLNEYDIWVEADGVGEYRNVSYSEGHKKIQYYEDNDINYHIIKYKCNYIKEIEKIVGTIKTK